MATLIICPACDTRYQIKAEFPPEGRKVRCAKCGHVWQAQPAESAPPAAEAAPQPAAPKTPPPPAAEAPAPEASAPEAPAPDAAAAPAPPAPDPAPPAPPAATPPSPPLAAPPPAAPPQAAPPPPPAAPPAPQAAPPPPASPSLPPAPQMDASFDADAGLTPDAAPDVPPPPAEPEPAKSGGLFGKLMGKRSGAAAAPEAAPPPEMAPTHQVDAPYGGQPDAAFDSDLPGDSDQDPALADPDLVAAAFGESASAKAPKKPLPIVPIGWGILGLIVLVILGLFIFSPATTVSILPGAGRVYSMLGIPVGTQGLEFEGVRYGWTSEGGQNVLEVQGNVHNTSANTIAVPTVVIALRDENGEEISEWTTEVGTAELGAGEQVPFSRQIPSPPSNVRSLKVRFAEAN